LIFARAWLSRSLVVAALAEDATVADGAGADVAGVPLPEVFAGATAPMSCAGSPQLISRMARTIDTVKNF
jgi:hypothetical protein